jgi:hypothetical protein
VAPLTSVGFGSNDRHRVFPVSDVGRSLSHSVSFDRQDDVSAAPPEAGDADGVSHEHQLQSLNTGTSPENVCAAARDPNGGLTVFCVWRFQDRLPHRLLRRDQSAPDPRGCKTTRGIIAPAADVVPLGSCSHG